MKMAVASVTTVDGQLEPCMFTPSPEESSGITALEVIVSAGLFKDIIWVFSISSGSLPPRVLGWGGGGIVLVAVKGFGEDCLAVRSRMGCIVIYDCIDYASRYRDPWRSSLLCFQGDPLSL